MAAQSAVRAIDVGGIEVTIERKRVKNVNMRMREAGRAHVSVPQHMTWAQAEEFVRGHADWLVAHGSKLAEHDEVRPSAWETGEVVRLWGKPLTLRVETDGTRGCEVVGEELVLRVLSADGAEMREALVDQLYRQQLAERLQTLLPECERRVGKRATSVTLRRMKTRWGSCTTSTGRIRLNVALAEFSPDCLEMVLIHELCHLHERNHGPRFQALMDLYCPGWRATQRVLDAHRLG
jgi:predicted metal-dependent hydrolase